MTGLIIIGLIILAIFLYPTTRSSPEIQPQTNTQPHITATGSTWEIKDNIFRRMFHARELYDWFHHNFPDSFSINIYRGDSPDKINWDDEVWSFWKNGQHAYHSMYRTEYTLYDRPCLCVNSGDENTYLRFMIEDENGNCYIVSWGYKRYDVGPDDYAAALAALIFQTCHRQGKQSSLQRYDFSVLACKEYYMEKNKAALL
jgi:hypothetical protein